MACFVVSNIGKASTGGLSRASVCDQVCVSPGEMRGPAVDAVCTERERRGGDRGKHWAGTKRIMGEWRALLSCAISWGTPDMDAPTHTQATRCCTGAREEAGQRRDTHTHPSHS